MSRLSSENAYCRRSRLPCSGDAVLFGRTNVSSMQFLPLGSNISSLKTEAAGSSETLVSIYQTTRRHIQVDRNPRCYHSENHKSINWKRHCDWDIICVSKYQHKFSIKGKIQEILLGHSFKGVFRETRVESGTALTCHGISGGRHS